MADTQVAQEAGDMTRPYTRVSPDMEAHVIAARERMGTVSYADIAERTGYPERTVKYILVDLPRLRRVSSGEAKAEGSLKRRIMQTVETLGMVKDVEELRRILGMADTDHDVMHVLHSLHTQGKLDFTERGNGMGTATVVNIRLPKKGKHSKVSEPNPLRLDNLDGTSGVEVTDLAVEPEATAVEAPQPAPSSAPGPEDEGYPLLDELLERERRRQDLDPKALAYVAAAEAILATDTEMFDVLMKKADEYHVTFNSPLEAEYLRWVKAHSDD